MAIVKDSELLCKQQKQEICELKSHIRALENTLDADYILIEALTNQAERYEKALQELLNAKKD